MWSWRFEDEMYRDFIIGCGFFPKIFDFCWVFSAFANRPAEEIARSSPSYDIPQSPSGHRVIYDRISTVESCAGCMPGKTKLGGSGKKINGSCLAARGTIYNPTKALSRKHPKIQTHSDKTGDIMIKYRYNLIYTLNITDNTENTVKFITLPKKGHVWDLPSQVSTSLCWGTWARFHNPL